MAKLKNIRPYKLSTDARDEHFFVRYKATLLVKLFRSELISDEKISTTRIPTIVCSSQK